MTTRWRLAAFLLGGALFAYLLYHVGLAELAANLQRAGWVLLPICLLWIPVYLCRTVAWRACMGSAPGRPPFWRTLGISVVIFAINLVTPFLQAGGEVLRVKALAPYLGNQRATASTVTYYLLHALSNLALWLVGLVVLLAWFPLPAGLLIPLLVSATLVIGIIAFIIWRHQEGIVAPLARLLHRLPLLGERLAARLEARRAKLEELDRVITSFYRNDPRGFALALAVDTLGRVIATAEYWFAAHGLGIAMNPAQTLVVGALGALVVNVIFFVPLEAGVKEGGFYLVFQLVGLDPALGVFAAIVQRLREFIWIGLGLACIPLAGGKQTEPE